MSADLVVALPCDLPIEAIGGKARGLQELMRLGLPVPPAFVITARAARAAEAPPEPALCAAIAQALNALGPGPLAVRSSGIAEDGAEHSFAGMHDTILDVEGVDAVIAAVRRCWASALSDRAQAYRARRGLPPGGLAVIVQRLVRAEVAGVVFSCDPVARRKDRVIVEAVPGLGEALVAGRAAPDRAVLARTEQGLAVLELQGQPDRAPCLDEGLAREVARMALAAEADARPVDIEWAWAGGRLWLLQLRPVTTPLAPPEGAGMLVPARQARIVWTNTNAAEVLPDVAKPLVFDAVRRYVDGLLAPLVAPFGIAPDQLGVIGLVAGRVYFNMNAVLGWARAFPGSGGQDPAVVARLLGGDVEALAAAVATLRPEDLPQHVLPWHRVVLGVVRVGLAVLRRHRADASDVIARLRAENDRDTAVDVRGLSDAALHERLEHLTRTPVGGAEAGGAMAAALVGMICQAALPALTARWLGDAGGVIARRLLQGLGGLDSAEAGLALLRLSQLARAGGVVDQLAGPWDEVRARLSGSAEGRRFLDAFAAFLARHGHHARGECDLSVPRWAEEPAYVLRLIQGAAGQAGPAAAAEERRQARERLLAELRPRLGPLRHRLLVAVADRAARGAAARETGRSEAIRRASLARWTVLEIGRRLRERGLLAEADDVFFLHLAEVPEALAGADLRPRIGERRAEHQRHLALSPPPIVIGQWQPEADPAPAPPPQGVLRGIAASPGIVEGPARLVLRADDEVVVRPGEVLVAPFTDPGWTPYFLSAAGVVMDFGGMLSHGSVIAREYGLPAVVNVGQATRQIRTGQRVRVDGDTGTVTIFP